MNKILHASTTQPPREDRSGQRLREVDGLITFAVLLVPKSPCGEFKLGGVLWRERAFGAEKRVALKSTTRERSRLLMDRNLREVL